MDTVELTHILTSDQYMKKYFIGVYAANHVPSNVSKAPVCFIANTDPSWKPGCHWVAVYVDHENNAEFFDSYGRYPDIYHNKIYGFLKRFENCKLNHTQLQSSFSSTCGQFCLYFLYWRCRGVSFERIMSGFDKSQDTNDFLVTTFVNGLFDKKTKVYDVDYIVNQCCRSDACSYTNHF